MALPSNSSGRGVPGSAFCGNLLYKELWHACAGPLVSVPRQGERVYYFPQGHMEQLEASTQQGLDHQMPLFDLPSKILCRVVNVELREENRTFQRLHECSQHDGMDKGFIVLKSSDIYELLQKSEVEEGNRTADWWTKSDWAFLNEPPLDQTGKTYNYASQFHVAEIATKTN